MHVLGAQKVKNFTQHLKFTSRHKLIDTITTLLLKQCFFHTFLVYLQILLQNYGTTQCLLKHWLKHKCVLLATGHNEHVLKNIPRFIAIVSYLKDKSDIKLHFNLMFCDHFNIVPIEDGQFVTQDFCLLEVSIERQNRQWCVSHRFTILKYY